MMTESTSDSALRIALCEDTSVDADLLVALIDMSTIPYVLDTFPSGEALLEVFAKEKYDLIFLDVYMGELTGVQTAERIRDIDTQVVIVFTTTSDDFTREGYRLNAYKYLLKPVVSEDVLDALELATLKRDKAQGATLAIVTDNVPVVIPLNDIVFVESSNRRSLIYTTGETYATTMTIDALEKLLPSPRFLRSHRSYIVNLDHVDDLEEDFIMDNGDIAYVAVKNHRKIKHAYDDYLFSSVRGDG
ncbi:MAG: LytTR family DNA-binding domain-containing protein [Coriobacteriales bacterium]|jgi:DNA-binding LytR/AlgR family response regulator|nr:LytTR family DNA-binding domain-containing protein [Coriobacteriales bacterium]